MCTCHFNCYSLIYFHQLGKNKLASIIFDINCVFVYRWWTQFKAIPWPDRVVYNISAHIQGCDDEARMIRRTLVRYINLAAILIFRAGSKRVRKRFPTLAHVVEAGKSIINVEMILGVSRILYMM